MSINLINYALAKKDWKKAYEDLKVLGVGGRNLIRNSLDFFIHLNTYQESTYTTQKLEDGKIRVRTEGGTHILKVYKRLNQLNDYRGKTLTFSFDIENKSETSLIIFGNYIDGMAEKYEAGFNDRVSIVATPVSIGDLQIQFRAPTPDDNLDFVIGNFKVEKGDIATPWTPAPEDINAHPFVAELAETVFRSKQNEERIRDLENAITALGGGS